MKKKTTTDRGINDILGAILQDMQEHPQTAQEAVTEIQALGHDLKAATQKAIGLLMYGFALVTAVQEFLETGKTSRDLTPSGPPIEQIKRIAGRLQG